MIIMEPRKAAPCLKAHVTATLVALDDTHYVGTNGINVAVKACPRIGTAHFTNYAQCKTVCQQPSHAEVSAILLAGDLACGATIYLEGHHAPCPDCVRAANAAGIKQIIVGSPPKPAHFAQK